VKKAKRRKGNKRRKSEILEAHQLDHRYCKDSDCLPTNAKIVKNPKFFIFRADFPQETDEMKKLIKQLQQKVETLEAEKKQETAVIERVEHTLTPDPKVPARAKSAGEGARDGDSMITISLQEFLQIRDSTRSEYKPKDPKKRCVFDLSSAASGSVESDAKESEMTVQILKMLDKKLYEANQKQALKFGIHVPQAVEAVLKVCSKTCAEQHLMSTHATTVLTGFKAKYEITHQACKPHTLLQLCLRACASREIEVSYDDLCIEEP